METLYKIIVVRNGEDILCGQIELKTAEGIHGKEIKTINYDSKTIYLFSTSPYGLK